MLDELLSPAAQRAVDAARCSAQARGHAEVEVADLLAGILADEESRASVLLRQLGADLGRLRGDFAIRADHTEGGLTDVPFGRDAAGIVRQAKQLAGQQASFQPTGSEELLIALLRAWEPLVTALAQQGVAALALAERYDDRHAQTAAPVDAAGLTLATDDAFEQTDRARIVDASANRAREALRMVEDYARFALDDAGLSARLKQCRHELRAALAYLPADWLAAARETTRDVGTNIVASDEHQRRSLRDLVAANCKRAEEALRTLEECAKTENAFAARQLQTIRYEVYSIERLLLVGERASTRLRDVRLYWLVDPDTCCKALDWMVAEAVAGGVGMIQLRDKASSDRDLLALARDLRQWTRAAGALFIINDRPDLARLVQADGVHVGQDDLPVKEARRIVGPDALIGVSTHTIEQARAAVAAGADYLGVGPVFPSKTKAFAAFPGIEFVRQATAEIRLPAFCIGGIGCGNLDQVLEAGGTRVAVSAAISSDREPRTAAAGLCSIIENRVRSAVR